MALRISKSKVGFSTIIKVDGALTGEGLAELEKVVSAREGSLRLDLSDLRSMDAEGLATIQALGGRGAEIVGASPYIALLIGPASSVRGKRRGRASARVIR